jgi:hypothetical protein
MCRAPHHVASALALAETPMFEHYDNLYGTFWHNAEICEHGIERYYCGPCGGAGICTVCKQHHRNQRYPVELEDGTTTTICATCFWIDMGAKHGIVSKKLLAELLQLPLYAKVLEVQFLRLLQEHFPVGTLTYHVCCWSIEAVLVTWLFLLE